MLKEETAVGTSPENYLSVDQEVKTTAEMFITEIVNTATTGNAEEETESEEYKFFSMINPEAKTSFHKQDQSCSGDMQ